MITEPALKRYIKFALTAATILLASCSYGQTVHILFDATKAEMAANADWVIDADQTNLGVGSSGVYITSSGHQSNPQRIPTPAQSGITASTDETYWTGALSAWGVDCAKRGYIVETLPWNVPITYGNTTNTQDLSNYDVYIIDEPNTVFAASEKTAIIQFVQNGGSLFIISDHNGSDRNGDGWDSPHVWNDLFSNNSVTTNPFGITFDLADFSGTTTNISATSSDSIIHGPMGAVTKAEWSDGTSMTLDTVKNPTIKAVIFKSGTTPGTTNALVAYGRYGSGKIAAIGDSSPPDDGTGNPTCTLYDGYYNDASGNHQLLLMNMTIWLADRNAASSVNIINSQAGHISVYPNPSAANTYLTTDEDVTNAMVTICDATGKEVLHTKIPRLNKGEQYQFSLTHGFYIIRMESAGLTQTLKLTVY